MGERGLGQRVKKVRHTYLCMYVLCVLLVEDGAGSVCGEESGVSLTCSANRTVACSIAQTTSTAVTNTEVSAWQQHGVTGVCETDDTLCSSIVI